MNNSIEITARSVEEALKKALQKLNLTEDEAEIEIMEESSKGFLGILGGKMAKVKVTAKLDPLLLTKKFLTKVTEKMGLVTDINSSCDGEYAKMEFIGENLGILIGRRGDTLDALQYLANLVANKQNQLPPNNESKRMRIILDAEGYRQRREETLIRLAQKMADRVKKTGRKVVLEPMNPQERRIIHTALQDEETVQTISEGTEPFRRIIIKER